MELNCTGKSHPPKSIVFAPYFAYSLNNGVRFKFASHLYIPLFNLIYDSLKIQYTKISNAFESSSNTKKGQMNPLFMEFSVLAPESYTNI